MTEPITIYGGAAVARALGIAHNVFTNYVARYDDTPPPSFIAEGSGYKFWTAEDVDAWRQWHSWAAESA